MDSDDAKAVAEARAIEKIAYHKWLAAGCPQGEALCFWLNAEREWQDKRKAKPDERAPVATLQALPN